MLRTLVEVHEIPVDERYPDCVFVEDPVIMCDDTALITITGTVIHINIMNVLNNIYSNLKAAI